MPLVISDLLQSNRGKPLGAAHLLRQLQQHLQPLIVYTHKGLQGAHLRNFAGFVEHVGNGACLAEHHAAAKLIEADTRRRLFAVFAHTSERPEESRKVGIQFLHPPQIMYSNAELLH